MQYTAFTSGGHRTCTEITKCRGVEIILAHVVPSQTSTMFVDVWLYRFYNTLTAFTKGLSLNKFDNEIKI
jgi:uncharacterized membrane protein